MQIPTDESNLVCRALADFTQRFSISGGFECWLDKQIPAGAGMGGASSDAASALLCAAGLCGMEARESELAEIASQIGSDVPFFLGPKGVSPTQPPAFAARAQGRGTQITPVPIGFCPHLVVAFPGVCLSTAAVYRESTVPETPQSADSFLNAWELADQRGFNRYQMNRLAGPAKKLVPQIDEILESMWRYGARTCQLTGSGSACFAVVPTARVAATMTRQLQAAHSATSKADHEVDLRANKTVANPGILVRATTLRSVPARVDYRKVVPF